MVMPMPDYDAAENEFADVYRKHYPLLARKAVDDVAADLGRDIDPGDALEHVTGQIGKRVKGIVETQRERIQGLVNQYDGNPDGLKAALQEALDTSELRARVISQTETHYVINQSRIVGASSAGLKRVLVYDGDEDEDCASVDGTYQSLDWALENPLAHPMCQRSFEVDQADLEDGDEE
jgi:hypothetical protein